MITAFKTLREIHRVFDAAAEVLEEDIGKPICLSNCGLCCQHNSPRWMFIEAIFAVSVLTGIGKLSQAVATAEGWLLEHHKEAKIYEGMPVGWASPQLRDEFNTLRFMQCPFLGTDMRCQIYEVRPLVCRAYGVTRDIAEICPRPPGRGETLTQRRYIPGPELRKLIDTWVARCRETNKVWVHSGSIPSVFYRVARPEKFVQLVRDNLIASAKIVGIEYETSLMWQPQVDAIRVGTMPELALLRR